MQALINADELANDVAGAEALLDRHQEHKVAPPPQPGSCPADAVVTGACCVLLQGEIDAHEDSFRATDEAGQALVHTGHYASEEVTEKVSFSPTPPPAQHAGLHGCPSAPGAAGRPGGGEGVSAAPVGGAPAAVRAVHGPAALLQGHRAGGQLDEQAGGEDTRSPHSTDCPGQQH